MAEAGFYWTGTERENDTATCFVCGKTLDGWESEDDPWKEHLKHAPQCEFVKLGRVESDMTVSCNIRNKTVILTFKQIIFRSNNFCKSLALLSRAALGRT